MELNLKRKNIKPIKIEGATYSVDCNDLDTITAFDNFMEKQKAYTKLSKDTMINDCKELLDIVCPGMWDALFDDNEKSMAPYYLCLDLKDIVMGEFLKDKRQEEEKESQEVIDQFHDLADSMESINRSFDKASGKYGAFNDVAKKRRPSKKRRH